MHTSAVQISSVQQKLLLYKIATGKGLDILTREA